MRENVQAPACFLPCRATPCISVVWDRLIDSIITQLSYLILVPLCLWGSYFYKVPSNPMLSEHKYVAQTTMLFQYLWDRSLLALLFFFLFLLYCFPPRSQTLETARAIVGNLLWKCRLPEISTLLSQQYNTSTKPITVEWRWSCLWKQAFFFCSHHCNTCVLAVWRNRDKIQEVHRQWTDVAVTNQLGLWACSRKWEQRGQWDEE